MIKGSWINRTITFPESYRGDQIPNVLNPTISYSEVTGLTYADPAKEGSGSTVTGYYICDDESANPKTYTKITEQDAKAQSGTTYYRLMMSGTVKDDIGTIGNVYGGSFESLINGSSTVNIGTETEIYIMKRATADTKDPDDVPIPEGTILAEDGRSIYNDNVIRSGIAIDTKSEPVLGAHITGNVYGGGDQGDVGIEYVNNNITIVGGTSGTTVNIGAKKVAILDEDNEPTGEYNYTSVTPGASGVTIAGNVYGGGKGLANTFKCDKGMVSHANVYIGNGTIGTIVNGSLTVGTGNVYGGGEIGRTEGSTTVMIGTDTGTSAPDIKGSVFGAGKGVNTHGYSALVRGNSTVTIQSDAKVGKSVYGGGEVASVGRYNVNAAGMPESLANEESGNCTVTIQGNAEIGPNNMTMPTFNGNVFGGCKGVLPYEDVAGDPYRIKPNNTEQWFTEERYEKEQNQPANYEDAYLNYIETLALATQTSVTITGNAFIKGSVYGGSENGIVQHNTNVTISGGQIGCGRNTTHRHVVDIPTVWDDDYTPSDETNLECASWTYGQATGDKKYAPYDKYTNTSGDDGHTFYGNVFGGGSGYFPYAQGKWHRAAGAVYGNTNVTVTGGHILTSLYGGNELTNVGKEGVANTGKCTINFGGTATLGVPRTLNQIAAHPVTCYLFGGGKGDQRLMFETMTNVNEVEENITGGWIYGSVFGGSEDGHVLHDVDINISGSTTKIGTWGTSYVDGNVFGGGRGYSGEDPVAGAVGGKIDIDITGGTMLGSIYGGGRLGSVGLDLSTTTNATTGEITKGANFGKIKTTGTDGDITINISGGTIGNDYEFKYIAANTTIDNSYRTTNHIPFTEFDSDNRLMHTKGGNVYAGGMGRREKLDGNPFVVETDGIDWHKLGNVKSTKLTISGANTWIKGNVFGGGEFGAVTGSHAIVGKDINASTEIIINGGTIGTVMGSSINNGTASKETGSNDDTRYAFGSVYGGGYGTEKDVVDDPSTTETNEAIPLTNDITKFAAVINGNTYINMTTGKVRASVYGGGEMAGVTGNTYVNVGGGEIGVGQVRAANSPDPNGPKKDYVLFGGWRMGNVYGGGKGSDNAVYSGLVAGNSNVKITAGEETGEPFIYHNVYGGGACGSVGTFTPADGVPSAWASGGTATVTVNGGTIGINGWDNGMVNGSGRGEVSGPEGSDPYDKLAWVKESFVTIGETGSPAIKGSVYGGGENGHNYENATVNVKGGTIGVSISDVTWGNLNISSRGNVYGAGCGTDTYTDNNSKKRHNAMAGVVRRNTYVTVEGGTVINNVYGGGSMGSVGTIASKTPHSGDGYIVDAGLTTEKIYGFGLSWPYEFTYGTYTEGEQTKTTGLATVIIKGNAHIGEANNEDGGFVFGGPKGTVDDGIYDITQQRYAEALLANVRETQVTIGTSSGSQPTIRTVYGGGEDGHVYENTTVIINGGTIERSVFGGGKGEGVFSARLWKRDLNDPGQNKNADDLVYSWTAGKVYGNTTVTMNGGKVGYFIFGGGNLGSVGKGNYSGGTDDYSTTGYGEMPPQANQALWTNTDFKESGVATVNLFGGTVGPESSPWTDEDGVPYGSIFGGSRGMSAASFKLSPRYRYVPEFFLGYTNKTIVNIGGTIENEVITEATGDGPTIYGSIYGGGQDGHVRNSTEVRIFKGKVLGQGTINDPAGRSGNVFGAGSGIGTYDTGTKDAQNNPIMACNNSSGSVTCTTLIEVYGTNSDNAGTATTIIKGNIYGGGAMASVGPPQTGQGYDEYEVADGDHKSYSFTQVNIKGGRIEGSVFAASRGPSDAFKKEAFDDKGITYEPYSYATVLWPNVQVSDGVILGSVYGGGETGYTKCGVNVDITGGTIKTDVYGGGAMANTNTGNLKQEKDTNYWRWTNTTAKTSKYTTTVNLKGGTIEGDAYGGGLGRKEFGTVGQEGYVSPIEALVYGDVLVELNDGVSTNERGCVVSRVFGCNNLNGSPQGHVQVHVHATQPAGVGKTIKASDKFAKFKKRSEYTSANVSELTTLATNVGINTATTPFSTYLSTFSSGTDEEKKTALENMIEAIAKKKYDVLAVYGGGNLAAYTPMGPGALSTTETNINNIKTDFKETKENTEVIIDGCDVTSIKQVYGGGNAASTPATYVIVNGSYEIDEVFGGGNGADNYSLEEGSPAADVWYQNPGANVGYRNYTHYVKSGSTDPVYNSAIHGTGAEGTPYVAITNDNAIDPEVEGSPGTFDKEQGKLNRIEYYSYGTGVATTDIKGGKIHRVYGGSNEKGNISTTALSMYQGASDCPMDIDEAYGAGKNAGIDGTVDQRLKCAHGIKEMFGGAMNADVDNDISLTITNGSSLERVFGGNNTSGAINGTITVTIEEGGCEPIRIGELYAGGYLAPYSVYGYETESDGNGGTRYKTENVPYIDNDGVTKTLAQRIPLTSGTAKRDPIINVISATYIGNIYGGGYQAKVVGNPRVNVNMTNGYVEVKKTLKADSDDSEFAFTETVEGVEKTYVYKDDAGNLYKKGDVDESEFRVTLPIGTIGNIYGGGNLANIVGDTYVEIGTGEWLNKNGEREMDGTIVLNNENLTTTFTYDPDQSKWTYLKTTTAPVAVTGTITPDGGGVVNATPAENETVTGTCAADDITTSTTFTYKNGNWTYEKTTTAPEAIPGTPTPSRNAATITDNVFGGGKGKADNFLCDKAMIGVVNSDEGSTNVIIGNGEVRGNVYGGGEIGRVEKNTSVTVGLELKEGENRTSAPDIKGSVFGAGKGIYTHGYSGLVRGNSTVTVQNHAKVGRSVYGGGEMASVGKYSLNSAGMPVSLVSDNKGICTVVVKDNVEVGPNDMKMTANDRADDTGYVFGGGRGVLPYKDPDYNVIDFYTESHPSSDPWRMNSNNEIQDYTDEAEYLKYIESLALATQTDVTIGGNAFIKGSVYGGSENGIVQHNTHVTIQDNCQIGNGYVQMADDGTLLDSPVSVNRRYTDAEWAAGHLFVEGDPDVNASDPTEAALRAAVRSNYQHSLPECASWEYKAPYAAYDILDLDENDKPKHATDGHTFYGNVFGGGSGLFPYKRNPNWVKDDTRSEAEGIPVDANGLSDGLWHEAAGAVYGNTVVEIKGGHILTSVYGGNEMTNVGTTNDANSGLSTVKMSGGTLGVPRTLGQIAAHPVTCYLFGAGKGDQRVNFNTSTNVNDVVVEVTDDARIYGSVFGGGEDGHVLNNVKLDIKTGTNITVGTGNNAVTYRYPYIGTTGTSYVDGNVFGAGRGFSGDAITAGSVGGNVEVNISDGTMLGSVYGGGRLASVGIGFNAVDDAQYGSFTEDVEDDPATANVDETKTHGHITVNISGGTIGNNTEVLNDANNTHTKGGNVFGGSMGRLELLNGDPNPMWPQLGQAKTTTVNISGSAVIKSNVYGGGEIGTVRDKTTINISGGTVNRDVYGGGYGSSITDENYNAIVETAVKTVDPEDNSVSYSPVYFGYNPMKWAGMVGQEVNVNISGGRVKKSVYGGGEMASVGIFDYKLTKDASSVADNEVEFSHTTGENPTYTKYTNIVKHAENADADRTVTKNFALSWPYEFSYIPTYEGKVNVTITGGRIGLFSNEDGDNNPFAEKDNGDVYGGGKGIATDRYKEAFCANVGSVEININYPTDEGAATTLDPATYKTSGDCIAGAVYGGGENGHVMGNTKVTLTNGLIGHSLYGGGSGKGKYTQTIKRLDNGNDYPASIYSITSGKVYGNTNVTMTGGYVVRHVYGGGNTGSVGKGNYAGGTDDFSYYVTDTKTFCGFGEALYGNENEEDRTLWDGGNANSLAFLNSGKSTVKITGGKVGYVDPEHPGDYVKDGLPYGSVFGGCRGESAPNIQETPRYHYCPEFFTGYVNETDVTIGGYRCIKTCTDSKSHTYAVGDVVALNDLKTAFELGENDTPDATCWVKDGVPEIRGSVYGGGQDGHVRRDTYVKIYDGVIGVPFTGTTADLDKAEWLASGNVYGAGSGIGKYKYDFTYDGDTDDNGQDADHTAEYHENPIKEEDYSSSAGSVTRFTKVEIKGGTIHRNVYGGGSLASVGPPIIPSSRTENADIKDETSEGRRPGWQSLCEVIIAGMVGTPTDYQKHYGGEVYGASRGEVELGESFANVVWTLVKILNGADIKGNVYGGGDNGIVKMDTDVQIGGDSE